jgi:hypothetical protein
MNRAKTVALISMCTALLIGGQFVLSGVVGVEIVTVLLLCFSYCFGCRMGIAIATAFSLLRCLFFGFFVNVVVLYLIYYNLFALFFGWIGKRISKFCYPVKTAIVTFSAMIFTAFFTLLDDTLNIVLYSMNRNAAITYITASIPALVSQIICTLVTVSVLFIPLTAIIQNNSFIKNSRR